MVKNIMLIIYKIRLYLVIFVLLFSECATVLMQSYSEAFTDTAEKPDCPPHKNEHSLESLSINPWRSLSYIKSVAGLHNNEIISFFTAHPQLLIKTESLVRILLQPDAAVYLTKDSSALNFDSSSVIAFNGLLSTFQFNAAPQFPFRTTFFIKVTKSSEKGYEISVPDSVKYSPIRSKKSIMDVVMKNLPCLRYAYNWRLRQMGGIEGKIVVKFAVDEFGKVIFAQVVSTTVNDNIFENDIIVLIKRWRFCPLNAKGDITEIIYPFVFSQ